MESILFCMCPTKFCFPQLMFGILCNAKHVPKSIRFAQELKAQRNAYSTMMYLLSKLRQSGAHEDKIASKIMEHGQANKPMVCFTGDNYQRLMNAVASASAKNATRDTAHVVFTSAIKTGDVNPRAPTHLFDLP